MWLFEVRCCYWTAQAIISRRTDVGWPCCICKAAMVYQEKAVAAGTLCVGNRRCLVCGWRTHVQWLHVQWLHGVRENWSRGTVRTEAVQELLSLSGWTNPEPWTLLFSRVCLKIGFAMHSHQQNGLRALPGLLWLHALIDNRVSSWASLCWEFERFHNAFERFYSFWYCVLFTSQEDPFMFIFFSPKG